MKHIQILLALMMVAAFPATAPAQNYSLRELLQEGLQNSYSLKIVRNDEQTAANNNTLAYPIEKKSTGFYQLIEFKAEPSVLAKLETAYRRDERVIRFLTVKMEKYAAQYAEKRRNKNANKED